MQNQYRKLLIINPSWSLLENGGYFLRVFIFVAGIFVNFLLSLNFYIISISELTAEGCYFPGVFSVGYGTHIENTKANVCKYINNNQ